MLTDKEKLDLITKGFETTDGREILKKLMHQYQTSSLNINGEEIIYAMFLESRNNKDE